MSKHHDFRFDITSDRNLEGILKIAFSRNSKATGWFAQDGRLILSWHNETAYNKPNKWNAFMTPLDADGVTPMVIAWLKEQDFGNEPDTDGHNGKGFRVYNESWGYIDSDPYAFVAIEPQWITYDK
jgi:hypothetical protein